MSYTDILAAADSQISRNSNWDGISAESVARMQLQNRFKTGLDIAKYTAKIMRADMAAYDADPANYTQSLGCWHGFIGQQKLISIKKHIGTTKSRYLYLSGWMIAALRSEFGPLPDQSMHEKTSVPALIEELYTFLRQADARELGMIFRELDEARKAGTVAPELDEDGKAINPHIPNYIKDAPCANSPSMSPRCEFRSRTLPLLLALALFDYSTFLRPPRVRQFGPC